MASPFGSKSKSPMTDRVSADQAAAVEQLDDRAWGAAAPLREGGAFHSATNEGIFRMRYVLALSFEALWDVKEKDRELKKNNVCQVCPVDARGVNGVRFRRTFADGGGRGHSKSWPAPI